VVVGTVVTVTDEVLVTVVELVPLGSVVELVVAPRKVVEVVMLLLVVVVLEELEEVVEEVVPPGSVVEVVVASGKVVEVVVLLLVLVLEELELVELVVSPGCDDDVVD
jgi:hypothetical protein